ncbi:MAG: uroporphyrinogen decarboxylase family protein [Verrucomicrobiota bacterium]
MTQPTHPLPVDVVFHPAWWNAHAGITFDKDFFYHPKKRVESERRMEQVLYDRFGEYGLGENRNKDLPVIGAVHNAAGYLLSEMLGCDVRYNEDAPPDVLPAERETLDVDPDAAFQSEAFQRFSQLCDELKTEYGYLTGDVNWGGILNIALDLCGQNLLLDMLENPDTVHAGFANIAEVITRFVSGVQSETQTSSISVNRVVRFFEQPVWLHSECSNTMISAADYEKFIMPFDADWSRRQRPFGIHHCGTDPHRLAESYAKLPHLDFLDVGWGGDVKAIRRHLPNTFLNIRLDPVQLVNWTPDEIRETIMRLVADSAKPELTGVCCINMDANVKDEQVASIFETVRDLQK